MLLKDFKVKRPEKTKIQNGYVYEVLESVYDPVKQYNVEKRKNIGKMVDGEYMIPNEHFELYYPDLILKDKAPNDFSDVLHIGVYALISKLLKDLKLNEILKPLFENRYQLICDLIAYMITEESCDYEYFEYFERSVPSFTRKIYSDSTVSRLLNNEISADEINTFLDAWNRINSNLCHDVYVNYDSTNFPLRNDYSGMAEYGHAKEYDELAQVNLSYVSAADNSRPLSYCLYPGSIHDTNEVNHTLKQIERYGYQNIGFIFDRAYYSEKLVRRLKEDHYFFIFMLKDNYDFVQKVIDEYRITLTRQLNCYIGEYMVSAVTKKVNISSSEKKPLYCYVHVYYDSYRAINDQNLLLANIEVLEKQLKELFENDKTLTREKLSRFEKYFKLRYSPEGFLISFKRDEKKISSCINELGYFALLSEKKLSAYEVLSIYRQRDSIEKLFRALKSSLDFCHPGVHSKKALEAKVFLTFLASIIRNEIFTARRKLPDSERKNSTVPIIVKQLSSIEASLNSNGSYTRRYALTARQKKLLDLFNIKEKDIDNTIADFNHDNQ